MPSLNRAALLVWQDTLMLMLCVDNRRPSHQNRLRAGFQLVTPSSILHLSPSLLSDRRWIWTVVLVGCDFSHSSTSRLQPSQFQ